MSVGGSERGRGTGTVMTAVAFGLVAALTTFRTAHNLNVPGQWDPPRYGMQDFRDVFYYPVVAMLDGRNPYDPAQYLTNYPVGRPLAPYVPTTLLLHLPFGLLPYSVAGWTHFAMNVALVLALAFLCLRFAGFAVTPARVFGLGTLILLGRPAQMTLYIGQCALYLVIPTYLTLWLADRRPFLAGLAFAVTCVKPTFAIPLGILLLVRGNVVACVWGGGIAALSLAGVGSVLAHASGGVMPAVESFRGSYARLMQDPSANAASSIIRIDAVAFLSRLLSLGAALEGALTLMIITVGTAAAWTVERRAGGTRAGGGCRRGLLSFSLACVTILACTYHQAYDGLLLTLPILALATGRITGTTAAGRVVCGVALIAMLVPELNYFATSTVVDVHGITGVWRDVIALTNGAAMLVAFVTLTSAAFAGCLRGAAST